MFHFFVLLSGTMEIVQPDLSGEQLIAKHGPGEFTGEMTMIGKILGRCWKRAFPACLRWEMFAPATSSGLRQQLAKERSLFTWSIVR